jgi:uncharacterized protein YwqG
MTRAQLLKMAKAAGLGTQAEALAHAAADSVRLVPKPAEEDRLGLGASRFGGTPDLAPDQSWPVWQDTPLAFVAQINLTDLADSPCAGLLPTTGWLSFFYHPAQEAWGFDPKDRGSFQVLFTPSGPLARLLTPPDLQDEGRFDLCQLQLLPDLSLPATDSTPFQATGLARLPLDPFEDLVEQLWGEHGWGSRSKLFGYPDQIQGEMQEECALASGGVYCGNGTSATDPRTPALKATASDWQLLLQVTSHDEASMMWGDVGNIYFWLRDQDRKARAFDRAWFVLQCG